VRIAHCRAIAAANPSSPSAWNPGSDAGSTGRGGCGCAVGGTGGFATSPGVVQPAIAASAQAMIAATDGERFMWVIYLEAGVAVFLVLLIVWWTMRGKK
jgi:hypothetical protein